jgi:hypothetical protein
MGDQRAVLSPVQEGDIWRVQMICPSGNKSCIGEFSSENAAIKWINGHAWWLIEPIAEKPTSESSSAV